MSWQFEDESPIEYKYTNWHGDAAAWASNSSIVSGVGKGMLVPDAEIRCEQMAARRYNYCRFVKIELPFVNESGIFADAGTIRSWASDAM